MSATVSDRLTELGLKLPAIVAPVASYLPAIRSGKLIYTSGQLPIRDGKLSATGRLGENVSTEQGYELARLCALNALAAIAGIADLDAIKRIIRVVGFIASTTEFHEQPAVLNGASDLLTEVFDKDGQHARSAVGVAVLPLNAPVEVEMLVEIG